MLVFGKVRSHEKIGHANDYVSAQLTVKNVERELFFCLKKGENIKDLMAEVKNVMNQKLKVQKPDEISFDHVKKKYAFELEVDVDEEKMVECVKVSFSFSKAFKGDDVPYEGRTYKGFFGNSYTPAETLILHKSLKGPGWIGI